MTDKERLQDIKNRFMKHEYDYALSGDDVVWLINRVEELEEEKDEWKDTAQAWFVRKNELLKQNIRYKQAFEEIIRQHELEDEIDDYDFMWNVKQIARQALEG